jgi:Flp pilus assembly protein TadD
LLEAGLEHHAAGRLDAAQALYRSALHRDGCNPDALHLLGMATAQTGRIAEGADLIRMAIEFGPAPEYRANLGGLLMEQGRPAEAEAAFHDALALRPDWPDLRVRLGNARLRLGRPRDAADDYRAALALRPDLAEAWSNLGGALLELDRPAEAEAACDAALALRPDLPELHENRAHILLRRGDFEAGWREFAWRRRTQDFADREREFSAPCWAGEAIAGDTILIHAEQGLGDTIQFARYLPLVAALGARVVLEVPPRLKRLFGTLSGVATLIGRGEAVPDPAVQCPLLDLPRIMGPAAIPAAIPYLGAEPERVEVWRRRLSSGLSSAGLRVGIVWQGNPAGAIDRGRSIPLDRFAPLAAVPGVRLFALQKHHGLDQLDRLPEGMVVETPGCAFDFDNGADGFLDTAAVMMNLDLIVTSDTAAAHLAGALGRPAWVALKAVADWRWLTGRDDSPWYPTLRLFRQEASDDWAGVFDRIARELDGFRNAGEPLG